MPAMPTRHRNEVPRRSTVRDMKNGMRKGKRSMRRGKRK